MSAPESLKPTWISPEEYLRLEALAEEKHEYVDGVMRRLHEPDPITGMAGSSSAHIQIVSNILFSAASRLRERGCQTFGSDAKLRLNNSARFYYPDATIACDPVWASETNGVLDNPSVIFEVLSPSTQNVDKSEKLDAYLALASVQAVVFVSSTKRYVEVYERQDGTKWLYQFWDAPDSMLRLEAVDVDLPLTELYDRVTFETANPQPLER